MTTFNTGNPIGSTAVKDLYDNAENLDFLVNDRTKRSHPDRLGVERKTWHGIEEDFQNFLLNSGYQQIGDYGPGLEITDRNQVFWRDGELYRAGAVLELPYTTTGDWGDEEGLFVAVGDQVLRQQLADSSDPTQGAGMVGYSGRTVSDYLGETFYRVENIEELRTISGRGAVDGVYLVEHTWGGLGGGLFYWIPDGTQVDDNGFFVSAPGGVWARIFEGTVTPEMFGARGDGIEDDSSAWQSLMLSVQALDKLVTIRADGSYLMTTPVVATGYSYTIVGVGRFISGTDNQPFIFRFSECPGGVYISGHEWDAAGIGKGFIDITGCPNSVIEPRLMHNFKDDPTSSGLFSAIQIGYSEHSRVVGGRFFNIGQNFGSSEEQAAQYRCITVRSGCDGFSWENPKARGIFMGIVIAEFPMWAGGVSYSVGDWVLVATEAGADLFQCLQDHTSTPGEPPVDGPNWRFERGGVRKNDTVSISGGEFRNTRDNSVYSLEYVGVCRVENCAFVSSWDEPIVSLSRSLIVSGCSFRDTRNRAVSVDTRYVDIDSVQVLGCRFENYSGIYDGNFIVFRNATGAPYKVHSFQIIGNSFYSNASIGGASFIRLLKVGRLQILGNTFALPTAGVESAIRCEDTIDDGLIDNNTFALADNNAITFRADDTGSTVLYGGGNRGNGRVMANSPGIITQNVTFDYTPSNRYARPMSKRIGWASILPTSGQWSVGDIIYHNAPTAGGHLGWVCTGAGTPGTWKTFGAISA